MRWAVALFRSLAERRFATPEGVLATAALVLSLWLFWPEPDPVPVIDYRKAWQESLAAQHKARLEAAVGFDMAAAGPDALEDDQGEPAQPWMRKLPPRRPVPGTAAVEGRAAVQQPPAPAEVAKAEDAPSPPSTSALPKPNPADALPPASPSEAVDDFAIVAGDGDEGLNRVIEAIKAERAREQKLAALVPSPARKAAAIDGGQGGEPAWLRNAVKTDLLDDRPQIAVVMDDLGLNQPNTRALNNLPAPMTLAFLPYASGLEVQTRAARAAGHELLVHMPMEPIGREAPGPGALTFGLSDAEFRARLVRNLDSFEGFVGINNHMGSRLTADAGMMGVVMAELRRRGVLFLDSRTSSRSVALETARQSGVPSAARDIFLDHVIEPGAIRKQMVLTERVARQTGIAVAIGHPHDATLAALREWLPALSKRGFALVPVSAVVAKRTCGQAYSGSAEGCGRYLQAQEATSGPQLGQLN